MRLSIVIPSCGREGFLRSVDSGRRQQVPPHGTLEVLLVDNTREGRLKEMVAARGGGLRWVHEPTPGVSQARNRGVREARGTFIAFLDDDEVAQPGWAA